MSNLRFSLFFTWRYLFSSKTPGAIHIISGISSLAFLVGSAALIIILSALNGFEGLVSDMVSEQRPDFKVQPKIGKVFIPKVNQLEQLKLIEGIVSIQPVLEEKAVVIYGNSQEIVQVKGTETNYAELIQIQNYLVEGEPSLKKGESDMGIFSQDVAMSLNLHTKGYEAVRIFIPDRTHAYNPLDPSSSLGMASVLPSGVFVNREENSGQVLVPISVMRELLKYEQELSSFEIFLRTGSDQNSIRAKLENILGDDFVVKNKKQQNELIYKIFKSEKLATYLILVFILMIASFNMVGALTMLVLEKQKDVLILKSIGMSKMSIQLIFLFQGAALAILGGGIGLALGVGICYLQDMYGFIPLENSMVQSYPVDVLSGDVWLIWGTIVVMGLLSSLYPAINATKTGEVRLTGT